MIGPAEKQKFHVIKNLLEEAIRGIDLITA
jgi:hypothetical protein